MTRRVLYLVRHGEAGGAEPDAVLTDVGRRQAVLLGERMAAIPFAAIHHSPWDRAAQTADIIAAHHPGVPVRASDLLRVVILYLPDRVKLVAYNDTGHLPAELRGTGYPAQARI